MLRFFSPLHRLLEPELQSIEVWSATAIPSFRVVGLPGPEIIESCERVRAAIEASGFEFPRKRVLVNLSPAGVRKQGTGTDLAIALAVLSLSSSSKNPSASCRQIVASGELALDGSVRSAGRVLRTVVASITLGASDLLLAREDQAIVAQALQLLREVPRFSARPHPRIHLITHLFEAFDSLEKQRGSAVLGEVESESSKSPHLDLLPLTSETERSLMASAAGAHHLLFIGPKGTGKTASLEWFHLLQSRLSCEELLERMMLEELSTHTSARFLRTAPVRILPPQVRPEALVGGFARGELRPGEFSHAHGGTIIADEFPEWPRDSREALRDPMETGVVHLLRAQKSVRLPARFQLAASANLCRCGGWPRSWNALKKHSSNARLSACKCSEKTRQDYMARLSGPILDRIDIVKPVLGIDLKLNDKTSPRAPEEIREVTDRCRSLLIQRWKKVPGRIVPAELEAILKSEPRILESWNRSHRTPEVSLRRRHKEIRVALTLAALDQIEGTHTGPTPARRHFEEARSASAELWLHSLNQTRIRHHPQIHLKTPIDPVHEKP